MTLEAARDRKLGVKMRTLRVIMCPGIPPKFKKSGIMNGPQKLPEIQNWGSLPIVMHACGLGACRPVNNFSSFFKNVMDSNNF